MTLLSERVAVVRRFQRSIRIDTDLNDAKALEGFVCPKSSADVLIVMGRHVQDTGQAAFTWTGPYGSGKSSLVIALSAALNKSTTRVAEGALGKELLTFLHKAFPMKKKGWHVLPVVGKRAPASRSIGEALTSNGFVRRKADKIWNDDDVIVALEKIANNEPAEYGGLIVFLDEMGKFFEAAAHDGADIFLFQRLAEAASRSKGRLIIVGILHQGFDEYAQRIGRELRDEWSKVQGRFVDLAVTQVGDEQLELLSQAITTTGIKKNSHHVKASDVVGRIIRQGKPGKDKSISKILENAWPLHPIVACLLGPISRRRFGQNQRSLFGFLNSAEPFGFQEFIRNEDENEVYGPERLWDYLRANLEPAILASPDAHRWSMAIEVVERAEAISSAPEIVGVLKTVALLDLFRERSGLNATEDILSTIFGGDKASAQASQALKELKDNALVIFRKHLNAYAIHSGSDFDIEQAMSEASDSIREINFSDLRLLAGLQPIVAKRHYHETGALRWFDADIVSFEDLEIRAGEKPSNGAVGKFLIVIPTKNEPRERVEGACASNAMRDKVPLAIGISQNAWKLVPLIMDFLAITKISQENVTLSGDGVARREVSARLIEYRSRVEAGLQDLFDNAVWYIKKKKSLFSYSQLNELGSDICDEVFNKSPRILNELLNRDKPSSSAVSGEKSLLKLMVNKEGEKRLGIDGYPAEGGLFDSIILPSEIYSKDENGDWIFKAPPASEQRDTLNIYPLWEEARHILKQASDGRVSMADIFALWAREPYGLKAGLARVLGVAFVLSERDKLAIYREGVFQSGFTELDIDYLTADPASIQIRLVDVSGKARSALLELANVASRQLSNRKKTLTEPIDIAKALVGSYYELQPWVKRTSRLTPVGLRVRNILKAASDPNKLLFDDLPELIGEVGPEKSTPLAQLVESGINELKSAYKNLLKDLQKLLLSELGAKDQTESSLKDIRTRAKNIQSMGEFELAAFSTRMAHFTGIDADIEGIGSLVVNKPARDWVDADLDKAELEIADFCRRFLRAETFAHVRGRGNNRHAMAVMVSRAGHQTPYKAEFSVSENDMSEVRALSQRIVSMFGDSTSRDKNVILAALAEASVSYLDAEKISQQLGSQPRKGRKS